MELYLKINQNENSEFFALYDTLTPLRKKIWNKICQKARNYKVCNFSQTKLANWCGCSRSAVSEAFKLFKEWGWMWLQSRGWKKTKTLHIPLSKQQIDVVERKYFKRVEATYRATHTYITNKKITGKPSELKIKPFLLKYQDSFTHDQLLKLSLLPDSIVYESFDICKKNHSRGIEIKNPPQYCVEIAIKRTQLRGIPINYRQYYASRH